MSIKPATDEEIDEIRRAEMPCDCPEYKDDGSHQDICPSGAVPMLIARIEADHARIKRCHAIMQGMHGAIDPDRHSILLADAEKELSGEFCDGACTTACDTRAEADRAEIARLKAEVERLTPVCAACKGQRTTTPTGNIPCSTCNGTGRAR